MKHILVLIFSLTAFIYYQIDRYNTKLDFKTNYNSKKQELLIEESDKYITPSKKEEEKYPVNIISKTYTKEKITILKDNIDLNVDFYSQSPFGKWGPIFNETCEEASALIAINYIRNKKTNKEYFRNDLLKIVEWENKKFGDYKHTNVQQTAQILEEYFNFSNYEILNNPTIDDIKYNLNKGYIIIAPFYGLGLNPHYLGRGPEYHFMVIKGYIKDFFITHDVGTKHGENYKYNQKILFDRIHDYNSESILKGKKKIIILKKQK